MKTNLLIISVITVLCACQKDSDLNSNSCQYSPFPTGSKFIYTYPNSSNRLVIEAVGDTLINNLACTKLQTSTMIGASNVLLGVTYHHCNNGTYSFMSSSLSVGFTTAETKQQIYLKEDVGEVWFDTVRSSSSMPLSGGGSITTRTTSYREYRNIGSIDQITLNNGNTFDHILLVEERMRNESTSNLFSPSTTISIDTNYYSKNIGLIKDSRSELKEYNIL